jgi:hypothetical protein
LCKHFLLQVKNRKSSWGIGRPTVEGGEREGERERERERDYRKVEKVVCARQLNKRNWPVRAHPRNSEFDLHSDPDERNCNVLMSVDLVLSVGHVTALTQPRLNAHGQSD